jgi:hypothetical protein
MDTILRNTVPKGNEYKSIRESRFFCSVVDPDQDPTLLTKLTKLLANFGLL